MMPDSNEVKKLYFTHCVELNNDNEQELEENMEDKTYTVTVKYHNEPNAKIEAKSAKDRKDLEYQLNMDDEVEWYDFDEEQFNEGYSTSGYSWDEINGMIHIYEDGKLIDKYPDMESAEEAGWDLNELNESSDQMREKALKMKEDSNAFAILYGYRTKDGKEVELEPEEFATEEKYKERIQQITDSLTKLSDKDPRGNRYGYERNITFYTVYPNNNNGNKEKITEGELFDKIKAKYPTLDDNWNMGSDKTMLTNREFELLYELADKLTKNSPNQYKYDVKLTYEDYGAGMKWYNIICYDKKGNSWQVLNTKEWLDLMNTKDVDSIYDRVISGEYFQDKQKDIKDMNMGELFNHMED